MPEEIEKPKKKAAKKKLEIINKERLDSCVGSKEISEKVVDSISKLCKDYDFDKVEFVRNFRAFRLYRKGAHLDWIDLNEINYMYGLGFPKFKGEIRKYQKPMKRAYRGSK